jgi:crossover junction endodeoxyribonuclease RuvC
MIRIGIDIGVSGAIAVFNETLVDVFDVPIIKDGPKNRSTINAPLLADLIANSHAIKAYIEWVGPRPGEGAVGAFAFGRARGVVEGVCAALSVPVRFLTPPQWKRKCNLPPGRENAKDLSRSAAIARWPDKAALFARVKDSGRSDAALIGLAGIMLDGEGK